MKEQLAHWVLILGLLPQLVTSAHGDDIFWDGETSSDWQTGTNWQPTCSGGPFCVQRPPGEFDHAILASVGSLASDLATLSDDVLIERLTIADGTRANVDGFDLRVSDMTHVTGAGSALILSESVQSSPTTFLVDVFHLDNGGEIRLGGIANSLPVASLAGASASTIGVGSSMSGLGLVGFNPDVANPASVTALINNGAIRARFGALTVFSVTNAMLDLDGLTENGILDADDGSFLSTDVLLSFDAPLADPFHGTARIGQGDRIHFVRSWQFGSPSQAGGVIELNGESGEATLSGGRISMFGGNLDTQIKVASGTGVLDAELLATTGQIVAFPNTTVHFKQQATLSINTFLVGQNNYNLIVDETLSIQQPQFDWDSPAPGSHDTIINEGGRLAIFSNEINPVDNTFRGEATLNGGWLTVNTTSTWRLEGQMVLRHTGNVGSRVDGTALVVGDGFESGPDAQIQVSGSGLSEIDLPITFRSDAELQIDSGAELELRKISNFQGGAEVTGPGTLRNRSTMTTASGVVMGGRLFNSGTLNIGGNNQVGNLIVGSFTQAQAQFDIEDRLNLELQSSTPGDYDQLIVNGTASLFGTLGVDWLGVGLPSQGDQFQILTASNVTGMFETLLLPPVEAGNVWNVKYNPTSVILEVVAELDGDFDNDGDVDGNDFLVWQRGGSPNGIGSGDLALWQSQYGLPLTAVATAVPEPGTLVLLSLLLVCISSRSVGNLAG